MLLFSCQYSLDMQLSMSNIHLANQAKLKIVIKLFIHTFFNTVYTTIPRAEKTQGFNGNFDKIGLNKQTIKDSLQLCLRLCIKIEMVTFVTYEA